MRILKIPAKIIIAPVIAAIWLVCLIGKVATHLSCYIFGPVMLIIGIILIIMAFNLKWINVAVCGGLELACLAVLFGAAWMIANLEDLNALLIRFEKS